MKKFQIEIHNFYTGDCRERYADWNKKTEFSNFKTLGKVKSGSLK